MPRWLWTATLLAALASSCKTRDPRAHEARPASAAPAPARAAASVAPRQPALPQAAATDEPSRTEAAATNTELETQGLAAMQRMADMFAADARDCDKLAIDLKAFIADNRPLITQLIAYEESQNADQRAAFTRRNAAAQAAIGHKMQAALTSCASNPAVLAAMKDFPGE